MRGFRSTIFAVAAVAALFVASGSAQAVPTRYAITDLGTLGGQNSEANAINNNGQIAGTAETGDFFRGESVFHAFRWSAGVMTDLPGFPGVEVACPCGRGFAINDGGDVAGSATKNSGDLLPTFWKGTTLFYFFAGAEPQALGINNAGDVVGQGQPDPDACGDGQDWLYRNGTLTFINFPGGYGARLGASDVNNHGQVVGDACLPRLASDGYPSHAFVYESGTITDLGTLGGGASAATAISDSKKIVGFSLITGNTAEHAVRYQGGSVRDLGTLGGTNSRALAVNKSGRIVGWSDSPGGMHAFLFSGSSMKDLNTYLPPDSGWLLQKASGINDRGEIVGTGTHNGNTRGFLLAR